MLFARSFQLYLFYCGMSDTDLCVPGVSLAQYCANWLLSHIATVKKLVGSASAVTIIILIRESNTIVSAYTKYRYLQ